MTKLFTPTEVAEGSLLLGRWQLQNDELYTPLLGGVIKTIVTGSDQLTLTVANRHHPLMPSHYWAVRVNHTAWRRYSAALPIEVALPAERNLVEIMTAGNTDLDDVWSGNQGFARLPGVFRSPSTGSTISTPRRLGRPTRLVCRSSTSGLTTGALARPTLRPPTNNT